MLLYFHFDILPAEVHKNHLFNEKNHRTFAFASENCFARFFHAITTQCKLADYQVDGKKIEDNQIAYESFRNESFLYIVSNQLLCVVEVCCNLLPQPKLISSILIVCFLLLFFFLFMSNQPIRPRN